MIRNGQIVLFSFPQTDQTDGKLRPALVLRRLPGTHDDWLVCMITSQLHRYLTGFDEVITDGDPDFPETGLKRPSIIRISRLAAMAGEMLRGAIGQLPRERLLTIRSRLAGWILGDSEGS
ncbi:MAG: type II toxin-antitoxin system PemK/MazF family toxin [Candidatus Edwardsbacteria bacterium]|nr:type II toxin-antitoxin system PemK/MazF family toxin [Candidatus Edwardsbacteria bacterium]